MKEQLQHIIDNMQTVIDAHEKSTDDAYVSGYADACADYIQDLQELKEMIQKGKYI